MLEKGEERKSDEMREDIRRPHWRQPERAGGSRRRHPVNATLTKAPGRPASSLDVDIAQAAVRIQSLRDAGHLCDVRRLVLHLKPDGKRIGRIEVGSVRIYDVKDKG